MAPPAASRPQASRPLLSGVARPGSLVGNASAEGALCLRCFGVLGAAVSADKLPATARRLAPVTAGVLSGGLAVVHRQLDGLLTSRSW